jgi:ipoprotein LpqH
VKNGFVAVGALAVVAGIAGCSSSSPSPPQPPGALPVDTAHITVNGQSAGTMRSVTCSQVDQYMNIDTGDNKTGVSAVVQSVQGGFKLAAKSVQIRNLGGFSGNYVDGIVGNADATVAGNSYTISGTADGFNTDKPDTRTTATFQIKASC